MRALLPLLVLSCSPAITAKPDRARDTGTPDTAPPEDTGDTGDTGPEVIPGDSAGDTGETGETGDTDTWVPTEFEHLPVLRIQAEGRIRDTEKTDAFLEVIEEHAGTHEDLATAPRAYVVAIGIEIHGSSSTSYPKLGYKFECRNGAGEDEDCPLVGLPEGSDWVLHAPYSDKTYMRNALAYGLGRDVADGARWEPRAQHVELYLDDQYQGIYLLVERISREADRLDIPKTTLADGTVGGGFIVKVDQHRSAGFDTSYGTPLDWVSPKSGSVTAEEAAYLLGWFDAVEAVLSADTFADPTVGYEAWLDVDAWVDHWLLNELTHNIDAYRLSAFLWVDGPPGTTKLRAGPLWDFDRAWGNVNYCDTWYTYGWIRDDLTTCGEGSQFPMWWARLQEDPAFQQRLRTRWEALRAGVLSDFAIRHRIATMKEQLAEAQVRDQARWGTVGVSIDPNYYVGETWHDEIRWLEDWAIARAAWMDAHVGE